METIGLTLGIIGMTFGMVGISAFVRLTKLEKELKKSGVLNKDYK